MKVADLLESKFFEFTNQVKEIVPDASELIKGMIEDDKIDQIEVMDTVLFLFPTDRWKFHLEELLELKSINLEVEQKEKLLNIICPYVSLLRKVKDQLDS